MSIPLFQSAGAAEILRSAQKDAMIKQKLEETLSNLVLKSLGTRKWLLYRSLINPLASFLYYSSTTLYCLQTLGEEYTGIIQVDRTLKHVPSFYVSIICFMLTIGRYLIWVNYEFLETQKFWSI